MKRIESNEIQPILLNLLKQFKKYAAQNKFEFLLCGGSLLGAVRHEGFIPWDDDIDLHITKDTFEKLMALTKENPYIDEEKRYKIIAPGNKDYIYPYFKLIDTKTILYEENIKKKYAVGVWIDIFCLSYLPENDKEYLSLFNKQQHYKKINKFLIAGDFVSPALRFFSPILRLSQKLLNVFGITSSWCSKKILSLDTLKSSNIIGNIHWPSSTRDRFEKNWFDRTVELQFEDDVYLAPIEYDKVLKTLYGGYMKLPPEKDRVMHSFEAYYVE